MIPQDVWDLWFPIVRQFEGCKLAAYQDANGVWTIGWGHTGADVAAGLVWTEDKADNTLQQDLSVHYAQMLALVPKAGNWPAGRQAAIADFVYNLGSGTFEHSTLHSAVLSEAWQSVKTQLALWVHAGGKVENGLVRRRNLEIALIDT